jgi:dihydrofolate reductase
MTEIVAVVAVADNGVIGRDNALPWRQRTDLQHFKAVTMGRPVIMGRRTLDSIGRVLPGRPTIVLSRGTPDLPDGVHLAHSPDEAVATAKAIARELGVGEIMVIGGAEVYRALAPQIDTVELTEIHASPQGDAVFDAIDRAAFREVSRQHHPAAPPHDEHAFSFVRLERISRAASRS